jgi:hypothetical protein
LQWASEAYGAGLVHARRQELRPAWLRDHGEASQEFEAAVAWAGSATQISTRTSGRARDTSQSLLRRANAALATLWGVEDVVWISAATRSRLQGSRRLAASASSLLTSHAFEASERDARESEALAQRVSESIRQSTARFSDRGNLATWASWVDETVQWSARTGKAAVVIQKDEHRLTLYEAGRATRTYRAELGWNNVGDKRAIGDGATPEGRYFVAELKGRGSSQYHRALLLDYPNAEDLRVLNESIRSGTLPRGTRPGGLIEIHGAGGRNEDWTDGCVALTNIEIEELFSRVSVGTPVTIVGGLTGAGTFSQVAQRLSR